MCLWMEWERMGSWGRDTLYLCLIMVLALVKPRGLGAVVVVVGLGVVMVGMDLRQVLVK